MKRLIPTLFFLFFIVSAFAQKQDTVSTAGVTFSAISADTVAPKKKDTIKTVTAVLLVNKAVRPVKQTLWAIFLAGLLGGFAALLMPCIFPMLPLTVSYFTKGADN